MSSREDFVVSCLRNLRERSNDDYCVELLEIGIDVNVLFSGLMTFRKAYEEEMRRLVHGCLNLGVTQTQISDILDHPDSLLKFHNLLKEKESLKSYTEDHNHLWNCGRCSQRNSNKLLTCESCQYNRNTFLESASFKCTEGIIHYKLLSTSLSQYNLGAISACTSMALQAVYECLNTIQGTEAPFGCSHALLVKILERGAEYQGRNHLDIFEAMESRPELINTQTGIYKFPDMVDLQPNKPERGIDKGREYMEQIHGHVGCVITCQAQSIALIYVYKVNQFIVFDSHSREHNQKMQGACFLFFNSFVDVCCYIRKTFPQIDQSDIKMLSDAEQIQYAHLSVGQADFFCLMSHYLLTTRKSNLTSLPTQYLGSMSPSTETITRFPISPFSLPQSSFDLSANSSAVVGLQLGQFDRIVQYHLQQTGTMFEIQRYIQELTNSPPQLILQDELRCLRHEIETEKRSLAKSTLDCQLIQEKIAHHQRILTEQQDELCLLREEIASERRSLQSSLSEIDRNQSVNMRSPLWRDQKFESIKKSENDSTKSRDQTDEDYLFKLNERTKQIEFDSKLAHQFYFNCCICLDPEVDIEEKFDLEHDDHAVCRTCATNYIKTNLKDRHIPVKCMYTGCVKDIYEAKCFEVLIEEEQKLYLELSRRPHSDPQFRQCPLPDCQGYDLNDGNDCTCFYCSHHWCYNCQVDLDKSQHKDITCKQYQQWKKENDQGDQAMEAFLRVGLNDAEGLDRMRRCPNCQMAYMKDQACSHVVCTAGCGVHFCFRCANFHANNAPAIYNHQSSCPGYRVPA